MGWGAAIALVLSIIVGLWKFWRSKVDRRERKLRDGYNEIAKGVDENDTGKITSGFDRIRRA